MKKRNKPKDISLPHQKAYNRIPYEEEKEVPDVYKAIDNDLARDNLENHLPAGDLQDIYSGGKI